MKKTIILTSALIALLLSTSPVRADAATDFGVQMKQHVTRSYAVNRSGVIPMDYTFDAGKWTNVCVLTVRAPRAGTFKVSVSGNVTGNPDNRTISLHLSNTSLGGGPGHNYVGDVLAGGFHIEHLFSVNAPGKYKFFLVGCIMDDASSENIPVSIDCFEAVFMSDSISIRL